MTSLISRIRALPHAFVPYVRSHPKRSILTLIVVVGLFLLGTSTNTADTPTPIDTDVRPVTVASVGALSADSDALVLLGEVRSVTQAELRAQKSGEVTRVNVRSGQYVGAGSVLAEIQNASERAGILQAQGALAAAEAQLAKTVAGARGEDKASATAQAESAAISLTAAEAAARNAYAQAYSLTQDAVYAKADTFFSNAYTVNPSFRVRTAEYGERTALEEERVAIGELLEAWKGTTQTSLPASDIDRALGEALAHLDRIAAFLSQISGFVSEQALDDDLTATVKSSQETAMLGARTSIDSARSSVTGARQSLAAARSAQTVSSFSESKLVVGERPEDIAVAEASVTQAKGALAGAVARLEDTLIRTPISGTVSTFNVARGDFVSALEVVAVVANPGALEIEAFVSGDARERITVGMPVLVDGIYEGTVTSAAPGLDPTTKKARITIGVSQDAALPNGSFVEIAIGAETPDTARPSLQTQTEFRIPITAIKVLPRGLAVFTVSESGVLKAHTITEGPIVGSQMLVKEGLTADMRIVTDVRGFAEGDQVVTSEK